MRSVIKVALAAASAAVWLTAGPARALAHDPPASDNPLVLLLLQQVLETIPGWLFLVAVPAVLVGTLALLAVASRRRLVTFLDEPD